MYLSNSTLPGPLPSVTENDTIAMFPPKWLRDQSSPYLRSGYHDGPGTSPSWFARVCATLAL